MRCCCCLHLLGPPRVRMYRFCCPLGTWLPTQPTAFWRLLIMSSLPNDGEEEFATILRAMPMCSVSLCRRTARPRLDGHLALVASITGLELALASVASVPTLVSVMTCLAREK